ncbi:hypothetical protein [uncultured Microbacterium sp.]|uniref:hypothetical protein n=1 Tax=uncultured Microbacterium sp. TaxID=191216 RepID=UPI002629503A|nr:hypothetical protein [uncultured Microbacterium sp.]
MLVSGFVAIVFGAFAIGLVRDDLHINCSMLPPGSEGAGEWICSDGIGYIGIAAALGAGWLLVVVAGVIVAFAVRDGRDARLFLVLLAAASMMWGTTVTGLASVPTGAGYWAVAVGPAALVGILGIAVGAWSLRLRERMSWIAGLAAAVAIAIAAVLQPGLSLTMIPAVGLLLAAALRTQPRRM